MVRLTDLPVMTLDVYCGRKTTIQQQYYNRHMPLMILYDSLFFNSILCFAFSSFAVIGEVCFVVVAVTGFLLYT